MDIAQAAQVLGEDEMRSQMSKAEHRACRRPGPRACLCEESEAVPPYRWRTALLTDR